MVKKKRVGIAALPDVGRVGEWLRCLRCLRDRVTAQAEKPQNLLGYYLQQGS